LIRKAFIATLLQSCVEIDFIEGVQHVLLRFKFRNNFRKREEVSSEPRMEVEGEPRGKIV
jgi:hypothetical protein